jgi:predicted GNAT family N-acyltransferase
VARDSGTPAADGGRIGVDPLATIQILEVRTPAELERAFAIRRAVFMEEQGVPEALELDGRDHQAQHLLALLDGAAVGTLRVRWLDGGRTAKIERVAVLPGARGSKIGQALLQAALALAGSAGAKTASLHAQTAARGFYGKLGFVAFGPEFMEDGIPHIAMRLSLHVQAVLELRPQ